MSGNEGAEKLVSGFLSRWSRRKVEARVDAGETRLEPERAQLGPIGESAGEASAENAPASASEAVAPVAPLPTIEDLRGIESEYSGFLRPEVDESLRRTALKKLFQDPHFNVMDGLDTYIDDYTQADPIPEAMLKTLNQAKGLLFDRDDHDDGQAAAEAQHAAVDAGRPRSGIPLADQVTEVTEVTEVTGPGTALAAPDSSDAAATATTGQADGNPTQQGSDGPAAKT